VIEEQVPAALANERVDRIVAFVLDCSRSDAVEVITAGGVEVDGAPARSGKVRLAVGQVVRIDPSFLPIDKPPTADPDVTFEVVYADDDVVVIDKPPGLVVHPAAGHQSGTLVNGMLARFPQIASVGEMHRPGVVHRLDVGTSGLMIMALTEHGHRVLGQALARREVRRIYRALAFGHLTNPNGVVDAPIGRDHRDPLKMAVVVDGKPARTHYTVRRTFTSPAAVSELECRLETGRTHQIRVHLAAIGHPVVGDVTYGGGRDTVVSPRPFLHAAGLAFIHPTSNAPMEFTSEPPTDLQAVLAQLGE
jgi:23S rRNA pseudouridine1911/1915/1917 synthase